MNFIIFGLLILIAVTFAQYQYQQQPTTQYNSNQYQATTRGYNNAQGQQQQQQQYGYNPNTMNNQYGTTPRYTSQAYYASTQNGRLFDQPFNSVMTKGSTTIMAIMVVAIFAAFF